MKIIQSIGGLGSQMCAYALFLDLKNKYPKERVYFDTHFFIEKIDNAHNGEELQRIFGIKENLLPKFIYQFLYSKNLMFKIIRKIAYKCRFINYFFDECYNYNHKINELKGNYLIFQTWTSIKYFDSIKENLSEIFYFFPFSKEDEKNFYIQNKIKNSNSVSIHIRRGDYIDNPILGNLISLNYYKDAINIINERVDNPQFFIFSDDTEWVKENFRINNAYYINWNKENDSYKDMQLMSMCKHNIIPNSSFSWWAALLNNNPNKIVINPKKWSNKENCLVDMAIQNSNWIILDNEENDIN